MGIYPIKNIRKELRLLDYYGLNILLDSVIAVAILISVIMSVNS